MTEDAIYSLMERVAALEAAVIVDTNTYDVDGAIVNNCQVEFIDTSFPVLPGTTITNVGLGGPDYNGTGAFADYTTIPSGSTGWLFNPSPACDYITVPYGPVIDNLEAITIECIFRLNTWGVGAPHFFHKQTTSQEFGAYIGNTGQISIQRGTVSGSPNIEGWAASSSVNINVWHFVQITWACGTAASGTPPIICIDNDCKSVTQTFYGTGDWNDDSANPLLIGEPLPPGVTNNIDGTVALYRLHNTVIDEATRLTNYNASKWRGGLT